MIPWIIHVPTSCRSHRQLGRLNLSAARPAQEEVCLSPLHRTRRPNEKSRIGVSLPVGVIKRAVAFLGTAAPQLRKYPVEFVFYCPFFLQTSCRHKFQFNSSGLKTKTSRGAGEELHLSPREQFVVSFALWSTTMRSRRTATNLEQYLARPSVLSRLTSSSCEFLPNTQKTAFITQWLGL